ncbi:MAG: hypothetical protein ACE5GO_06315, partial [Anaerolineales bacterium]
TINGNTVQANQQTSKLQLWRAKHVSEDAPTPFFRSTLLTTFVHKPRSQKLKVEIFPSNRL